MRRNRIGIVIIFALSMGGVFARGPSASAASPRVPSSVVFVENRGQYDEPVEYVLRGPRGTVFFTPTEVVFAFVRQEGKTARPKRRQTRNEPDAADEPATVSRLVFRYRFKGANENPDVVGDKELPGRINVLAGSQEDWKSGIPTYEAIVYRNIYPGTDIRFHTENNNLRYDIILRGDADLDRVRFVYEGVERTHVNDDGTLVIRTPLGDFVESPPAVRRDEEEVTIGFMIRGSNTIGFATTEE